MMTKEEKSWILYDVGNSAFALIVITTIMPIFFKEIASQGVPAALSTSNWGFANSLASLTLAILAPILGVFADYRGMKKRFFLFFLFVGVFSTLLLSLSGTGAWLYCLFVFIAARIGWAGANVFYDSFLVDVAEKKRMDLISTRGYAWGYIGSVIPFLVVIALILFGEMPEQNSAIAAGPARIGFLVVAAWWLLFSLPLIKSVPQKYFVAISAHPIKGGFKRLGETFKKIRQFRPVFLFLVAYFFYIDGVDTIISMATAYGMDLGLSVTTLIPAILMIQIVSFPFALMFGRAAEKYSAKTMIYVGIGVYSFITLLGFFLPDFSSMTTRTFMFWLMAFLVATSMGGIQALSRSYFGKLIPASHSAEFFGFYNIFGKFATIAGPFIMGVITRGTGHSRYGVLGILILFVVGGLILSKVKDPELE